jgi:hypothetical protein
MTGSRRWDPGIKRVAPFCAVQSDKAHRASTEDADPIRGGSGFRLLWKVEYHDIYNIYIYCI